jgi:thiamine biosynthesis lipoprotein ApbE
MNPKERQSENNKIGVYVTHKLASFADGFSTALFVTPLDISIDILNKVSGLE